MAKCDYRFHITSRRPYWCPKTMERRPSWCLKPVLWELSSFLMQTLSFVPINLHRCWPREWKHSWCLFILTSCGHVHSNAVNPLIIISIWVSTKTHQKTASPHYSFRIISKHIQGHPLFFLRLASSDRPKFLAFSKKKSNDVVKPFFTWNNYFNLKNEHRDWKQDQTKKNLNLVTSFPYPHVDVISFDSDGGANMFGLILFVTKVVR